MNVPPTLALAHQAERVAVLYRRLVLLVGGQLLVTCLGQATVGAVADGVAVSLVPLASIFVVVVALGATAWGAQTAYELTKEMGSSVAWLWGIGILVPCVSVLVLLVLSQRAQSWCKERGIKVGLLGPTKESIEQLKRQSSVDRIFK